ncbi:MAG TPA: DUF5678 domain-containing protein [Blastocatellia bacterium]|nr:DUF5678 domain-containing protein [Blastocatellia bacterium]
MSSVTVESILSQVSQLPPSDRARLIEELTREAKAKPEIFKSRIISTNAPFDDRHLEYEWLAKHRREYIGQWIALKGNRLIAHGTTGREVFASAREQGIHDAFVLFVEDPDIPYIGL